MKFWLAAALLSSVYAAVIEDLLTSAAQGFYDWASSVGSWSSGVGYDSAMIMQLSEINPLSVQISQLSVSVQNMPVPDQTEYKLLFSSLANLTSAVTHALSAVNAKAADYYAVGANQVIGTDISGFSGNLGDIVGHIAAYIPSDPSCDLVSPVASAVDEMASSFTAAGSTFSTSIADISTIATGNCTSAASTKGKAQSENGSSRQTPAKGLLLTLVSGIFVCL